MRKRGSCCTKEQESWSSILEMSRVAAAAYCLVCHNGHFDGGLPDVIDRGAPLVKQCEQAFQSRRAFRGGFASEGSGVLIGLTRGRTLGISGARSASACRR